MNSAARQEVFLPDFTNDNYLFSERARERFVLPDKLASESEG